MDLVSVQKLTKDLKKATVTLTDDEARFLVNTYYTMQDNRIRTRGQERQLEKVEEPHEVITFFADQFEDLENEIKKALSIYTKNHLIGTWLRDVHGIGPVIAAGLIAYIDINQCPTAGHIWAFAGWAADGQKPWGKGIKMPFCREFRTLCCHPNTWITTSVGQKRISDIKIGDEVLTHKGRFRKVKQVHISNYTGGLIGLKTWAHSAGTLYLSDNHPVYTETRLSWTAQKGREKASFGSRDRTLRVGCLPDEQIREMREERRMGAKLEELAKKYECSMSAISQICNEKTRFKPMENERMWVRSDGIQPGWLLSTPRIPHGPIQTIYPINSGWGSKQIPDKIEVDEDIAWLFGIFLAEGHVIRNYVKFSLHREEIVYQQNIRRILKDRFGLDYFENYNGNGWQGIVSSKALSNLMTSIIGTNSFTMKIPMSILHGPAEVKASFLRGWFEGDSDLETLTLTTSSVPNDAHALLNSLGIASTITPYQNSYKISVMNRDVFNSIVFNNKLNPHVSSRNISIRVEENTVWSQACDSTIVSFNGVLFNLEVDEDESYTANGIAVHNCWKAGQSFMMMGDTENNFYGRIYRERKAYEQAKNQKLEYSAQATIKAEKVGKHTEAYKFYSVGKLPPAHIDARARRHATKLFLSHLHQIWYEKHFGVPAPKPFALSHLNHVHMINPPH